MNMTFPFWYWVRVAPKRKNEMLAIHPNKCRLLNGDVRVRKNVMVAVNRKTDAGYIHATEEYRNLSVKKIPAARNTVSRNMG